MGSEAWHLNEFEMYNSLAVCVCRPYASNAVGLGKGGGLNGYVLRGGGVVTKPGTS